jgi:hypothetical protein
MPQMTYNQSERKERLGINLADTLRILPEIRGMLLTGKLYIDQSHLIWVDKNIIDDKCIPFACDLLQSAVICDIIRQHDRRDGKYPTRVYICRQSAWERIPSDAVLTIVEEDEDGNKQCVLNPRIFPLEVVLAEPIIPEAKRIDL